MFYKLITKLFCSKNINIINKLKKVVIKINKLEKFYSKLSNKKIIERNKKLYVMLKQKINLNIIIPESFALIKEVSKRTLNINYFNTQLIGGLILCQGNIIEMYTGEGKTLTSIFPIYLNFLLNKNTHVVTINEYLAKRDAKNNKILFDFLNIRVGINLKKMNYKEKKNTYKCDIIYGTSSEFCFDYLRDNMIYNFKKKVQKKLDCVLIDEVDSILIDENINPLIISGNLNKKKKIYYEIDKIVNFLKNDKNNYFLNKQNGQLYLKKKGLIIIEKILIKKKFIKKKKDLYLNKYIFLINHIILSLKAHLLFKINIDYIIKKKKIVIIDKNTGRLVYNKKWSDGLHQAIEAKENLKIDNESKIFASITIKNYFLLYKKISGMTGTAITESSEFYNIYNLETFVIPTNLPIIRKDLPDLLYMTKEEKYNSIVSDIKNRIKKFQPVLIGTTSIIESEIISKKLNKENIYHQVLNAKFHDKEAYIISQAGKPGNVTISTNMAGRGVDIILGGNFKNKISNCLNNK
ncbi:preprotein translocase subunit SecA, partial [Candidatus Annandia adelgestsuga]|uniref:preprotein translocase subunit SecA n=1 Tax=Candidatus Annandia adelgestsuga TaxID=1302411 RepID=UPI002FCD5DEC